MQIEREGEMANKSKVGSDSRMKNIKQKRKKKKKEYTCIYTI